MTPLAEAAGRSATLWIALALIAINTAVYAPVRHHDFLNYDDSDYVSANPAVAGGLTPSSIAWAFTTGHSSNWHPLTWLSHMLDVQLYGMSPGPHHVTNAVLHIANTLLLFWILYRMTGAQGRSAFVAGLFAVHPLHVQSVAWIAERKDMLSTFLWLLTTWAYVGYVRQPQMKRYVSVVVLFALGLMAKPMLVTLPFTLLLLDFWPLRRADLDDRATWLRLVVEKLPLFVASAASSIVTLIVQQQSRSVVGLDLLPISNRIANAAISYFAYIQMMVWPANLAILYPYRRAIPNLWIIAAFGVVALSAFALWTARRRPYLAVGWFWYLGTLVPVIGLIQVGAQSIADRYTYVPLIGLFIIAAWAGPDLLKSWAPQRRVLPIGAAIVVAGCMAASARELTHWKNSTAVWEQALKATTDNAFAQYNMALVLVAQGKEQESLSYFSEAVRIDPRLSRMHKDFASALVKQGRLDEALAQYGEALRISAGNADLEHAIGAILTKQGKPDEAIEHYKEVVRLVPNSGDAHYDLAYALAQDRKTGEAVAAYLDTLRIDPNYADAHNNLGVILASQGRLDEALPHFSEVVRLHPDDAQARNNLGSALASQGNFDEAIRQLQEAVRINPNHTDARNNLALALAKKAQRN